VTVVCTLADPYVATAVTAAEAGSGGSSSEVGEVHTVGDESHFQPIAIESLGPINASGCAFLQNLGRKLSAQYSDDRETRLLFQRISVPIQRFNAVLLHDSFVKEEEEE